MPSVHVPVTLAALGGSVGFDTLDDTRDLPIAVGTAAGDRDHPQGPGRAQAAGPRPG